MSTDYRTLKQVSASELFDGRLEKLGIREHPADRRMKTRRCLTDGRNYLWVNINDQGYVGGFSRYFPNHAGKILAAVEDVFDIEVLSEHEPQYWGFDTQAEWDAFQEELSREADEKFYQELLKCLRGEPNDIRPGTNGEAQAEAARTLVASDPSLLLPANKDVLLTRSKEVYEREHTEDDLPL